MPGKKNYKAPVSWLSRGRGRRLSAGVLLCSGILFSFDGIPSAASARPRRVLALAPVRAGSRGETHRRVAYFFIRETTSLCFSSDRPLGDEFLGETRRCRTKLSIRCIHVLRMLFLARSFGSVYLLVVAGSTGEEESQKNLCIIV